MSDNSSTSSTAFIQMYRCYNTTAGAVTLTICNIINMSFILPLCIIVLYLGLQRWRQQTSNTPMSHSDVLSYNLVLVDLLQVLGSALALYGIHTGVSGLISVGLYMLGFYLSGQLILFPLTCVDYYVAVVFPIFYLNLKKPKLIRNRNITFAFIWLYNLVQLSTLIYVEQTQILSFLSVISIFLLSFIVFSSFSVLYVLIRPGPGEGGRHQVDQAKSRAFNTMIRVLTVLTFRFVEFIVCNSIYSSPEVEADIKCIVALFLIAGGLPCSVFHLILFLHRTGKLSFCKNNLDTLRQRYKFTQEN